MLIDTIGGQRQEVILGVPWLAHHNPEIDWRIGEVQMKKEKSKKREKSLKNQQQRKKWQQQEQWKKRKKKEMRKKI